MIQEKKIKSIIKYLDKKDIHYDLYLGISDPGYLDEPLLCANWNKVSPKFYNYCETVISCSWFDEYTSCGDCGKAVRTTADYYSWEPAFVILNDCDVVCINHFDTYIEDIINEYKNKNKLLPSTLLDLIKEQNWNCYSPDEYCLTYESGLHPEQNDTPEKVAKEIINNLPGYDYIFIAKHSSQFDITWQTIIRLNTEE